MAPLESVADLPKPSPSFLHLVVVPTKAGLRARHGYALSFESMVAHSAS